MAIENEHESLDTYTLTTETTDKFIQQSHKKVEVEPKKDSKSYDELLKQKDNFQLEQLQEMYRDEDIPRYMRLQLSEVMKRVREGQKINIDELYELFEKNQQVSIIDAQQSVDNRRIIERVWNILENRIKESFEDTTEGRKNTYTDRVEYQKQVQKRREQGDSGSLRSLEAAIIEQTYNKLYKNYINADTDEKRNEIHQKILALVKENPDLLSHQHRQAESENYADRFEYYKPMYERALTLTERDYNNKLNYAETIELKNVIETLIFTVTGQARRSAKYASSHGEKIKIIQYYLSEELKKFTEQFKIFLGYRNIAAPKNFDEQLNNCLIVQKIREKISEAEKK